MEASRSLSSGREFERFIFGEIVENPDYITRGRLIPKEHLKNSSISYIIRKNWRDLGESLENGDPYPHNPLRPDLGKTAQLWSAVRKYLPRRIKGRGGLPLNLYISSGRNSLDWCHGIDAFFYWQGVYVTFDVSLRPKDLQGTLKADFVFGPNELTPEGLEFFGQKVAGLLRRRNYNLRKKEKTQVIHLQEVLWD